MALDTTFGQNKMGWTLTNNFYVTYSQVIDSQNRTIVVGQTGSESKKKLTLFISRYTSSGLLDTNFGQGGYVYGDYYTGRSSIGYGIVLDENENILVTGGATDDNDIERLLIAKYSSEGVIDPFFGGGKGWETYTFDYPKNGSSGYDITLDSSGLILVSANVTAYNSESKEFILSRYEKDGTLDKKFGGNAKGWSSFDTPSGSSAYNLSKILVEPSNGSILYLLKQSLLGSVTEGPDLIYKFTSDGILDNNFGDKKGYIVVKNGSKFVAYSDDLSSITLDQSGNILYTSQNYYDDNLLLVRYTSNGDLDINFGENRGYTITAIPNYTSQGFSLILDSNNRILVSGYVTAGEKTSQLLLARYTSNGSLDPTFGDNGLGYTIFKGVDFSTPSQTNGISLDNNGRIVITGVGSIINVSGGTLIIRYLNENNEPICLPAGTPILTDQGLVAIEKIDTKKHTIAHKRIVAITTTITPEKHLVCFEANSMGINCPTQRTLMTPGHEVLYKGKLVQAKHFVGRVEGVHTVPYNGKDVLYNVLQEQHGLMRVNNMVLETLHPENKVARIILGNQ
jgi:uncharacterized delta-60 repeat protein